MDVGNNSSIASAGGIVVPSGGSTEIVTPRISHYGEQYLDPELVDMLAKAVEHTAHFPNKGIDFCNIFSLTGQYNVALRTCLKILYDPEDYDIMIGIDARGFYMAGVIQEATGRPFAPARKGGKLPGEVVRVAYELEYKKVEVLDMSVNAPLEPGMRVMITDDLAATGGSITAAYDLATKYFKCEVVGAAVAIDLPYARQKCDVLRDKGIEIRTILRYNELPVLPPYDPNVHQLKVHLVSEIGAEEQQ